MSEIDGLLGPDTEINPFNIIAKFLLSVEDGVHDVRGKIAVPDASHLRRFLDRRVSDFPPTYVFIDNQDDDFLQDNPASWQASSYGCFTAIQQLRRMSNHRLHCFATLREEVYRTLKESEDFTKWGADIFCLRWQDDKLIDLFVARAKRLRRKLLRSPDLNEKDPLDAFFGKDLLSSTSNVCEIRNYVVESDGPGELG